ncbi:hypothetical protein EDB19DRAFT_793201 [Suillus lakei]|nr:hypothetical protein EDB19DRAFT_793201 [Suillus lakei]
MYPMSGPLRPIRTTASFCPLRPGASQPKKSKATSSLRILHHVAHLRRQRSPTTQYRRHTTRHSSLSPTRRHSLAAATVTHIPIRANRSLFPSLLPLRSVFPSTSTRHALDSRTHLWHVRFITFVSFSTTSSSVFFFVDWYETDIGLIHPHHGPISDMYFYLFISFHPRYSDLRFIFSFTGTRRTTGLIRTHLHYEPISSMYVSSSTS